MSELWVTGDTHFDHAGTRPNSGIIFHCQRPYNSIDEMNEDLVNKWNSVVARKDTVIHVGDWAFARHKRWINLCHGAKILILGNHDKFGADVSRCFSSVRESYVRKLPEGHRGLFTHYALRTWQGKHNGNTWNFYGHSHGTLPELVGGCDVGIDVWNYFPIHVEVLVRRMKEQESIIAAFPKTDDILEFQSGWQHENRKRLQQVNMQFWTVSHALA
jgi:calcineurin-like phosphoesterase family protein